MRKPIGMLLALILIFPLAQAYSVGQQVLHNFTLTDMQGQTHQLSDYDGQMVFINFFTTW